MLETSECIPIKNNGRDYTDCMEFSLLRFTHMIFYSEKQLSHNDYSTWIINSKSNLLKINQELLDWIAQYPNIYKEALYYTHEKNQGVVEREKWAHFVSDRSYFEYYRTDGAELFTNIRNIIIFCKEMLGMNLNLEDQESENLRIISRILSKYTGKEIKINVKYKKINNIDMSIENIKSFLSKPQQDINELENSTYKVISKRTILDLKINFLSYNWNLYEVYFSDEKLVSNKFITGHSVIM